MSRTYVVTGAASGIGAACARLLSGQGHRVVTADLHDADVIADLATAEGRQAFLDGVAKASDGHVDAVIANAGGGPAETSIQLNFFGAVLTLDGLRLLMAASAVPRAVAVSSISALSPPYASLLEACLARDEPAALQAARTCWDETNQAAGPDAAGLALYGNAKRALNLWCRRAATTAEWGGAGIPLNVVSLGFYDTPAAAYVLQNPDASAAFAAQTPLKGAFPGRPGEAAELLAWLTSPQNGQLTGQVLYADGGFEAQALGAA